MAGSEADKAAARAGRADRPADEPAGHRRPTSDQKYVEDFGRQAAEQGRHPPGATGQGSADPDAEVMAEHDMEGEDERDRGRKAATGSKAPMTGQVDESPGR